MKKKLIFIYSCHNSCTETKAAAVRLLYTLPRVTGAVASRETGPHTDKWICIVTTFYGVEYYSYIHNIPLETSLC